MREIDADHFKVTVKVAASSHFIHWIMALGEGVKIIGENRAKRKSVRRVWDLFAELEAKESSYGKSIYHINGNKILSRQ